MKKLLLFFLSFVLLGFGKKNKPITSKYLPKHFVYVPKGEVYLHPDRLKEDKQDSIKLLSKATIPERFFDRGLDSCEGFFISSLEVTNLEYKEFVYWMKQHKPKEWKVYLPDTTVWARDIAYGEPYKNHYYQHHAYNDYPVVGITLQQAIAYCEWLTEIYIPRKNDVKPIFSLPTKKQWIRAARGESTHVYPWGGSYIRNEEGYVLANFFTIGSPYVHRNHKTKELEIVYSEDRTLGSLGFITTAVGSYWPNQFGVYNMSGNVAELVADDTVAMGGSWNDPGYDIRVESEQPATEPTSTIGFRVIAQLP